MIEKSIKKILNTNLLRTLELDPLLSIPQAIDRVVEFVDQDPLLTSDVKLVRAHLESVGSRLKLQGIINPNWLALEKGIRFHFFLINLQPGGLKFLNKQLDLLSNDILRFILYSEVDSLVILLGTQNEAHLMLEAIKEIEPYQLLDLTATAAPLYYRYITNTQSHGGFTHGDEIINSIVDRYNEPSLITDREQLLEQGVILGPIWNPEQGIEANIIQAFVCLRTSNRVLPSDLLQALLRVEILRTTIVHLFETEGYPYSYFLKLVCNNMSELDQATNEIGFARIGDVKLDGSTLIVASGYESPPRLSIRRVLYDITPPSIDFIRDIAEEYITPLGADAVSVFNRLDGRTRMGLLNSVNELNIEAADRTWDAKWDKKIREAIDLFVRLALADSEIILDGAVMHMAKAVEEYLIHIIDLIAQRTFGDAYSKRIQEEFKMANNDVRVLTLGRAVDTLGTIRRHSECGFVAPVLSENDREWLKRLEVFSKKRNVWAHPAGVEAHPPVMIDKAFRIILEGISIIRWISHDIMPVLEDPENEVDELTINLQGTRDVARLFVSYASEDRKIADRISNGLKAFYDVWYDDWMIDPGESIVSKVNEGLAESDCLIVLLSCSSLRSRWVKHELGSAMMKKLSGQGICILFLRIDDCDIPDYLAQYRYIDMVKDFSEGFIALLKYLKKMF